MGILGAIERCSQVKFLYVKVHKACTFAVEDTIN